MAVGGAGSSSRAPLWRGARVHPALDSIKCLKKLDRAPQPSVQINVVVLRGRRGEGALQCR
jgi:hypothetical protein